MSNREEYTEYGYRGSEELKKAQEEIKELRKELLELKELLARVTNENK